MTEHEHEEWQLRDYGRGRYCAACGERVPPRTPVEHLAAAKALRAMLDEDIHPETLQCEEIASTLDYLLGRNEQFETFLAKAEDLADQWSAPAFGSADDDYSAGYESGRESAYDWAADSLRDLIKENRNG